MSCSVIRHRKEWHPTHLAIGVKADIWHVCRIVNYIAGGPAASSHDSQQEKMYDAARAAVG